MNKIKVSLKEEVKKELLRERENNLFESLLTISQIEEPNIIIEKLGETTLNLLSNGYSTEEITLVIEANTDWFGGLRDEDGNFNIWNTLLGGGKSMLWEKVLTWLFVSVLGTSESVGQSAATFLADYNPLGILKLFKGYGPCVEEMDGGDSGRGLAMALVEVFINNSQFQGQPQQTLGKGFGKVALRNVAAQAVRDSNLDTIIGERICGYIWKQGKETETTTNKTQPAGNKNQQSTNPKNN